MAKLIADWIFSKDKVLSGDITGNAMVLSDCSGNQNHLELKVWGDASSPILKEVLVWEEQGQGILFNNHKALGAGKFFSTCVDAPVNSMRFVKGYTIEVEIRLPKDRRFDPWMGIVTRQGSGKMLGKTQGERELLATLSFHDCFQWTWYPVHEDTNYTCWSMSADDLLLDDFIHVEIRNDGKQTRMYLNGVTDIRNPSKELAGIECVEGEGWNIGAALWDNQVDSLFCGTLKRVRIFDGDIGDEGLVSGYRRRLFVLQGSNEEYPLRSGSQNSLLAIIPDSQYMGQYKPEIVETMIQWTAENHKALDIAAMIHVGDVSESSALQELKAADTAFRHADAAGIPYLVTPGNHDYLDQAINFATYFGPERYAGKENIEFCPDVLAGAMQVTLSGRLYLILSLDSYCLDRSMHWAKKKIQQYRLPTIVFSHDIYYKDADGLARSKNGENIWKELIHHQDEIFMVIGGHHFGVGHGVSQNAYGNPVLEMLTNYQGYPNGGNGWLQLMEFDEQNKQVHVCTYSPWVDQQFVKGEYDFSYLTSSADRFSLPLDFKTRWMR